MADIHEITISPNGRTLSFGDMDHPEWNVTFTVPPGYRLDFPDDGIYMMECLKKRMREKYSQSNVDQLGDR